MATSLAGAPRHDTLETFGFASDSLPKSGGMVLGSTSLGSASTNRDGFQSIDTPRPA